MTSPAPLPSLPSSSCPSPSQSRASSSSSKSVADRWYFPDNCLDNTPSVRSGLTPHKELSYRQQAANFIQDMGQRLQVTQLCINTAIVYLQRFYMFHSFHRFHRNSISSAALFLAAKVEEQPRKLEHVIRVAHFCLHRDQPQLDVRTEAYMEQAQELVTNENILLQTLGFDVVIEHPHTFVVRGTQLVKASKELAQGSYFMATNSLHLTTMCLRYPPTIVACVCIHLACKWSSYQIPLSSAGKEWFHYVDSSANIGLLDQLMEEFLTIFEKCPSRLKRRVVASAGAAEEEEKRRARGDISASTYTPDFSLRKSEQPSPAHPPSGMGTPLMPGHPQQRHSTGGRSDKTSSHAPPSSSSRPELKRPGEPLSHEEHKRRKEHHHHQQHGSHHHGQHHSSSTSSAAHHHSAGAGSSSHHHGKSGSSRASLPGQPNQPHHGPTKPSHHGSSRHSTGSSHHSSTSGSHHSSGHHGSSGHHSSGSSSGSSSGHHSGSSSSHHRQSSSSSSSHGHHPHKPSSSVLPGHPAHPKQTSSSSSHPSGHGQHPGRTSLPGSASSSNRPSSSHRAAHHSTQNSSSSQQPPVPHGSRSGQPAAAQQPPKPQQQPPPQQKAPAASAPPPQPAAVPPSSSNASASIFDIDDNSPFGGTTMVSLLGPITSPGPGPLSDMGLDLRGGEEAANVNLSPEAGEVLDSAGGALSGLGFNFPSSKSSSSAASSGISQLLATKPPSSAKQEVKHEIKPEVKPEPRASTGRPAPVMGLPKSEPRSPASVSNLLKTSTSSKVKSDAGVFGLPSTSTKTTTPSPTKRPAREPSSRSQSLFSPPGGDSGSDGRSPSVKIPKVDEIRGFENLREGRMSIKVAKGSDVRQPPAQMPPQPVVSTPTVPQYQASLIPPAGEASSDRDHKEKKKKKKDKKEKKEKKDKDRRKDREGSGSGSERKHKHKHKDRERDRDRDAGKSGIELSLSVPSQPASPATSAAAPPSTTNATPTGGLKIKIKCGGETSASTIVPALKISMGSDGGRSGGQAPAHAANKMSRVMGTSVEMENTYVNRHGVGRK